MNDRTNKYKIITLRLNQNVGLMSLVSTIGHQSSELMEFLSRENQTWLEIIEIKILDWLNFFDCFAKEDFRIIISLEYFHPDRVVWIFLSIWNFGKKLQLSNIHCFLQIPKSRYRILLSSQANVIQYRTHNAMILLKIYATELSIFLLRKHRCASTKIDETKWVNKQKLARFLSNHPDDIQSNIL